MRNALVHFWFNFFTEGNMKSFDFGSLLLVQISSWNLYKKWYLDITYIPVKFKHKSTHKCLGGKPLCTLHLYIYCHALTYRFQSSIHWAIENYRQYPQISGIPIQCHFNKNQKTFLKKYSNLFATVSHYFCPFLVIHHHSAPFCDAFTMFHDNFTCFAPFHTHVACSMTVWHPFCECLALFHGCLPNHFPNHSNKILNT